MKDIYDEWRSYENDSILLRPVMLEDAAELLKVYSDEKARSLFNCDNFPNPSYFDTLEQMQNEIQFYLNSYQWKCFVRWTIISKKGNVIIGTIENFHRDNRNLDGTFQEAFCDISLLRVDLRSDYEKEEIISAILQIVMQTAYDDFHCSAIVTKAVKEAVVRRHTLLDMGFEPVNEYLEGEHGEKYGDYYVVTRWEDK